MRIKIPDQIAKDLLEIAQATGSEPGDVAVAAIRRGLEARET